MTDRQRWSWIARAMLCALALAVVVPSVARAQDPSKVVGPEKCKDCHKAAYAAWMASTHGKTFRDFQHPHKADSILTAMGERSARRGVCADCHYTQQAVGSRRPRAITGVSCESCHTGAKEWIDVHNDFGKAPDGKKATAANESPAHRSARLAQMAKLGMIRPDEPFLLATNCLQCHTVPNEKLVNTGIHPAGSDFELVSWLNGEVRHDFQRSDGKTNRAAPDDLDPQQHHRVLYVVGRIAELEQALRALGNATGPGRFTTAMTKRVNDAVSELKAIEAKAPSTKAGLDPIVAAATGAPLQPNQKPALTKAADTVHQDGTKVAASLDGAAIAGIDPLLPAPSAYKGTPYPGQ